MADAREQHVWDDAAERWPKEMGPLEENSPIVTIPLDWIEKHLGEREKIIVLDYGCGIGRITPVFSTFALIHKNLKMEYFGYDQNAKMVAHCKSIYPELADQFKQKNLTFENPNAVDIGRFDLIFTCTVLQHNTNQDKARILPKFWEMLIDDGFLLINEKTYDRKNFTDDFGVNAEYNEDLTDTYSFTTKGYHKFMLQFGFEPVEDLESFHLYRVVK